MTYLKRFGLFVLDFVVGDDWRLAAGVVVALSVVFALAHHGWKVWWMLPLLVIVGLTVSVGLVARAKSDGDAG